ncbi:major facilitator superfamily domain-containing protein [Mycena sp. CBHHK59/15]|nr:major facilitator superfamily domain-containing protein [Mycena sp. CBHHK59/15]
MMVNESHKEIHCTEFQATIGLSIYALGFGFVPFFTASLSESVGRQPFYLVSAAGCLFAHLMAALSRNGPTIIVARFLQGSFGGAVTIVGGTIADLWLPQERGLPMSIFSAAAFAGNGLGPVFSGWVVENQTVGWRWIQWIHMIFFALCLVVLLIVMRETRSSVLLSRIAKDMREKEGDSRYFAAGEDECNLQGLLAVSCTRPFYLLVKEPVVMSFSIWISFVWGVYYCMLARSIPGIFKTLHNFTPGELGLAYFPIVIGSVLGFITGLWQEKMYRERVSRKGPEARLYFACISAVFFPMGMFLYAWSAFPSVSWVLLELGIVVCVWATFGIYVSVFSYLTDCFGPFASSALAAQSLLRNVTATVFPLFLDRMFRAWSYRWANTLFACVALLLVAIPYVLLIYGPRHREHSGFSNRLLCSRTEVESSVG